MELSQKAGEKKPAEAGEKKPAEAGQNLTFVRIYFGYRKPVFGSINPAKFQSAISVFAAAMVASISGKVRTPALYMEVTFLTATCIASSFDCCIFFSPVYWTRHMARP